MREHKIKGPKCGQCEEKKAMVVSCVLYFSVHEYRISIFYLLVYIGSTSYILMLCCFINVVCVLSNIYQ